MSFWERHKSKLFRFGHIYATLYGLSVINYIPQMPTNTLAHRLTVIYSHVAAAVLTILCPVYFLANHDALLETNDRRWQLQLAVNLGNTLIKYVTVAVTYGANLAHYSAIREITKTRQELEDAFKRDPPLPFSAVTDAPRRKFERMCLFKFTLINSMIVVQVCSILYQHFWLHLNSIRMQYAVYTFVLWNYTENMADLFYFINCSALRFFRQLQLQLEQLVCQAQDLNRRNKARGYVMELCNRLCDQLEALALRCHQIQRLYGDGTRMTQFQILGLILTTLISNLTNLYTLFNLFSKHELDQASPEIALSVAHALVFYVDTYIVTLVSDHVGVEKHNISHTLQMFNGLSTLDVRLEQMIESFSLQLLQSKAEIRICGFFHLNRHLTYVTAAAGFSYFITLVQFDLSLV